MTLGIGIIGCGRMGHRHAEAYQKIKGVKIIGVFDVDSRAATILGAKLRARIFNDLDTMLENSDIHAVSICTPNTEHVKPALMAVKHGKHLLIEKPLATTVEDCDRIINETSSAGVTLMVGHTHRFYPCNVAAKKVLDGGIIGEIVLGVIFDLIPGKYPGQRLPKWVMTKAMGGGVLMLDAVHSVDRLRWWFKSEVHSVYAVGMSKRSGEVEDSMTASLRFDNGAYATITHVCPSAGIVDNTARIVGEKAELVIDFGKEVKVGTKNYRQIPFPHKANPASYEHTLHGFVAEMKDFIQSILQRKLPSVTGYDGKKAVEIIVAIQKSYECEMPVTLPIN